jgi:copper chaperone CopZ
MKSSKILFLFFFITTIIACKQSVNKISLDVRIDGMSCSQSCAPLIKRKLIKTEGVLEAEVSFERKLAQIVFNSSAISKEEVVKKIESIADGIYKASVIKVSKKETNSKKISGQNNLDPLDFNLTKPEFSHSSGFQLPNLFSLLNSFLK